MEEGGHVMQWLYTQAAVGGLSACEGEQLQQKLLHGLQQRQLGASELLHAAAAAAAHSRYPSEMLVVQLSRHFLLRLGGADLLQRQDNHQQHAELPPQPVLQQPQVTEILLQFLLMQRFGAPGMEGFPVAFCVHAVLLPSLPRLPAATLLRLLMGALELLSPSAPRRVLRQREKQQQSFEALLLLAVHAAETVAERHASRLQQQQLVVLMKALAYLAHTSASSSADASGSSSSVTLSTALLSEQRMRLRSCALRAYPSRLAFVRGPTLPRWQVEP
ncbi:putative superoxide dismutase [Cyclospora cayetanensis]|uniref:Superoxide dismutase n=1 Tax=Cyclospora cayetanensis TaxID=88456 RepID=A0A1D3CTB3_9EIME|nr:putative superoxide dismutase [Cyclospora cayetanensis]